MRADRCTGVIKGDRLALMLPPRGQSSHFHFISDYMLALHCDAAHCNAMSCQIDPLIPRSVQVAQPN